MRFVKTKVWLSGLFVLGLAAGASGWFGQASRAFAHALNLPNAATVEPFLYPPYPGIASEESLFDHTNPYYDQSDGLMVIFTGDVANKICPKPPPPGIPPPKSNVCDQGYGAYWSYSLGEWLYYNGHDGTDYGLSYRPLYAAADSDKVVYAGWHYPQYHTLGLGLYVKLQHANNYTTTYGHMSSVALQTCGYSDCQSVAQGEMIGISGTTGSSTGPHLHFRVTDSLGRAVDPYGWTGLPGKDPLKYNQSNSLWVQYPSIITNGAVLPTGPELDYPAPLTGGTIVDDTDIRFDDTPTGCWTRLSTGAGLAQNDNMRFTQVRISGEDTCTARWDFPGLTSGLYAVYVRVPAVYATSEGARYQVVHNGKTHTAVVDQAVFPNGYYVRDGWVYIGKFDFSANGGEYVQLGNRTYDAQPSLVVGADAVRFVNLGEIPPTLTPTPSRTPTSSTTPTPTRTPTITRTPTVTRTPTITRTPSRTPTVGATNTRWPTATPPYTKVNIYFADRYKLARNAPPYEVAGYRYFSSSLNLPAETLKAYFKGPGYTELTWGYITLYDGFTGFSELTVQDGVAHVYLSGACNPSRTDFTIADLLKANLKQFSAIQAVKIYDQTGSTQDPSGASDSIPACLAGAGPTVTPAPGDTLTPTATSTPRVTPSVTSSPTRTPTSIGPTPAYVKQKVYWVSSTRLAYGWLPYEVAGERWASTAGSLPEFVLRVYFQGPGSVERWTYGWIAIYSGFAGFSKLEITDGVAHIYLTGACNPGAGYTIAGPLNANLKQFPEIQFVKIYDENGSTQNPDGQSDSIPACLQP